MKPLTIAGACFALSLLTYFQFPGHTWLQQDTQIYAPIWNISTTRRYSATRFWRRNHTSPTRSTTKLPWRCARSPGLTFNRSWRWNRFLARSFGIWGLYLLALPLCGPNRPAALALFAAAICSLGAVVAGPSVLTFEYEPTPRAFALPLALCAAGLTVHRRDLAAGIAGAAAFVFHPPTARGFLRASLRPSGRALGLQLVRPSRKHPGRSHDRQGAVL